MLSALQHPPLHGWFGTSGCSLPRDLKARKTAFSFKSLQCRQKEVTEAKSREKVRPECYSVRVRESRTWPFKGSRHMDTQSARLALVASLRHLPWEERQ